MIIITGDHNIGKAISFAGRTFNQKLIQPYCCFFNAIEDETHNFFIKETETFDMNAYYKKDVKKF